MSVSASLDFASIPERIQSEVERAIQRSIKGVEYIASSGPVLGSTPKDILHVRGTMISITTALSPTKSTACRF